MSDQRADARPARGFERVEWRRPVSLLLMLCLSAVPPGFGQQTPPPRTQPGTPAAPKAAPPKTAAAKPAAAAATDVGWPRVYTDGTATMAAHQPQVEDWKDFKELTMRFAVEMTPQKGAKKAMAAVHLLALTDTDMENRTVVLHDPKVLSFRAPEQDEAKAKELEALFSKLLPNRGNAVALDRVLAYLDPDRLKTKQVRISTAPPVILVNTKPAVLVMVDGQPILGDIPGTKLNFIVNSNWDILKEKGEKEFYLLSDKQWLEAESLDGPWKAAKDLPKDTAKIPADENWKDVRAALPISKANKDIPAPWVYVVYKPAELILLEGEPKFKPIEGTMLSEVTNTKSLLFYNNTDKNYYFLISGRWFKNPLLRGNWEFASDQLPADFAKIPKTHAKAHVLASVPGTIEAADAVLLASVPQMAVVNRKEAAAQAKAVYVGAPDFKPIEQTSLQYAVNTPSDVIKHQDKYYLLQQGVWFVSATPNGPWEVADSIPQEIYDIPPESPKHNTTYVYVTGSDSESVTTAQTAGYLGMAVGVGISVAVWGTGYYYPPYYYYGPMYPYPVYWGYPYYSYGAAAWYNPATGFYGRGAVAYGPYGGYGRAAAYNPATGSYARRAGAYGPYQAAVGGSFYNARTGTWGAGYRYANPYQGWGQGVVQRGDKWARGGYYYDDRGAIGGIKTSEGGRLVAAGDGDNRGFIGRTSDGDLYAGKDGNIYRRDENGNWQQRGEGGWNNVNRDSLTSEQQQRLDQAKSSRSQPGQRASQTDRATGQTRQQPGSPSAGTMDRGSGRVSPGQPAQNRSLPPRSSTMEARPNRDTMSGLDRDAGARSRGSQNYGSWQNSGRSSGGFSGGGMRGGGGRMGGRRR